MTLNIAMLGTGRIADVALAPAIDAADGVRLWSVLSRDGNRALEFGQRHGAAAPVTAHDDIDQLLADDDLDAVLVASPDRLHAEQAIAAAAAGKHVLCEKPMCVSREEATAMVDACTGAGVKLAVAYHMRWHRGHRDLVRDVRAGDLGEIRHVRAQWTFLSADASNWRAGTELGRWWSLAGVGTHCLDQIRWLMMPTHGEVTEVSSIITNPVHGSPRDETAVVALRFETGATAEMCTSVLFQAPTRLEVYGSSGWAICEGTFGPHGAGTVTSSEGTRDFRVVDPYVGELEDFARAIAEDRSPEVDGAEGARNVDLLLEAVGA